MSWVRDAMLRQIERNERYIFRVAEIERCYSEERDERAYWAIVQRTLHRLFMVNAIEIVYGRGHITLRPLGGPRR